MCLTLNIEVVLFSRHCPQGSDWTFYPPRGLPLIFHLQAQTWTYWLDPQTVWALIDTRGWAFQNERVHAELSLRGVDPASVPYRPCDSSQSYPFTTSYLDVFVVVKVCSCEARAGLFVTGILNYDATRCRRSRTRYMPLIKAEYAARIMGGSSWHLIHRRAPMGNVGSSVPDVREHQMVQGMRQSHIIK